MGLTKTEVAILSRESSLKTTAKNPHSTAFGLGQLLRGNRMRHANLIGVHPDTTDDREQVLLFRSYVEDRYHTPENALRFWNQNGWY
jgi:hypothetical protein